MTSTNGDHYPVYTSPCGEVQLGAFKREYLDPLLPWANDPEATAGVRLSPPIVFENEVDWFEGTRKNPHQDLFAILVRDASVEGKYDYVGHTGLHQIIFPDARAITGTFIGAPAARGRGLGKIAKLLLLRHAFHHVGLRKVCSSVKAFNLASVGHLVACGYKIVGVQRDHYFYKGGYVNQVLLDIHRDEFEPIWAAYVESNEAPKLTKRQRNRIEKLYPQ